MGCLPVWLASTQRWRDLAQAALSGDGGDKHGCGIRLVDREGDASGE
jgi:hypothetical protein